MNIILLDNIDSYFLYIKENKLIINNIDFIDKAITINKKNTSETYRIIQSKLNIKSPNIETIVINS